MLLLAVSLTGCYANPDPTDWGPVAKKNFVAGCTENVTAGGGTTVVAQIEDTSTCECIYDKMVKTYRLSWEKMKAYEREQEKAKPADNPPTPPEELTKAVDACQPAGPAAP